MGKITLVPCMVFDALCYLEQRSLAMKEHLLPTELAFIEKINDLCADKLDKDNLGMSILCYIVTIYRNNDCFENYTLTDMAELFRNPQDLREVVKRKNTNGFLASFINPVLDMLVDEWADKYIQMLTVLDDASFSTIWEAELLPAIKDSIKEKQKVYDNADVDQALSDIQRMKQCETMENVKIYISHVSYPVAFSLHNNQFLDCVGINMGTGILFHELMHGFASDELIRLYIDYIGTNAYLTRQHNRLIDDYSSGNEEEFVTAAEYYLRMKYNGEKKPDLLRDAKSRYGGCMPTVVFLFDLLSQEPNAPNDYDKWLKDIFTSKQLPQTDIEQQLNSIVRM